MNIINNNPIPARITYGHQKWHELGFEMESDEKEAYELFLEDKRVNTDIPVDIEIVELCMSARATSSLTRVGITTVGRVCWYIERMGKDWGKAVRNMGTVTQIEVEKNDIWREAAN